MDQMLEQWLDHSIDKAIEDGWEWTQKPKPYPTRLGELRETLCRMFKTQILSGTCRRRAGEIF